MEQGICKECGYEKSVNKQEDGKFLCGIHARHEKLEFLPYAKGTVFIKGYGNESVARVDELLRRVPINMKKDGTYDVGRRCENGTIAEREPNY